jgi:hypothetical protein
MPGDHTAETYQEPEAAGPASPADDAAGQRAALEDLACLLVDRGMASPAIFVLESMRPISFITAEFLVFLEPFARLLLPAAKYDLVVEAMHDRANLSWLIDRLEELDEQRAARKGEPSPPADQSGEPDDRSRS